MIDFVYMFFQNGIINIENEPQCLGEYKTLDDAIKDLKECAIENKEEYDWWIEDNYGNELWTEAENPIDFEYNNRLARRP